LIRVCGALGVEVWLPKNHYLSFTNSPYYAHHRLSAIDIYPPRGEREVLSPIEGKLLLHKIVGGEHVLGFESGDAYVRILHVKPYLSVGESVSIGDLLGEVVWSPTFFRWTDPHLHLEVRPTNSFIGARGCVKLSIYDDLVNFLRNNVDLSSGPHGYVVDSILRGKYVVLKPRSASTLPSLAVSVGNVLGVMEGGIPHYGHAGIILLHDSADHQVRVGSCVAVNDVIVGRVDFASEPYVHVMMPERGLYLTLNGSHVYGTAFFIGASFAKVIPSNWRRLALNEGDVASLCFQAFKKYVLR